MDKILSTRIDESIIKRLNLLSQKLNTSKKAVIEAAILLYCQKIEEENRIDILDQTFGSWVREESPEQTVRSARNKFQKSMERHHE